ncbi:uncharacterized protein LOC143857976 [Tasmannia lanceolata]|uniref:uncharacterized protein LOC143857976 n=1 Tax=Tasmannia lanceolata TaxID=3420 RepID=UPI0040642A68
MMNKDNSRDGFLGHHKILGDITNRHGKREFSLAVGDVVLGNKNEFRENVGCKADDGEFSHQVCRKIENLVKGKENVSRVSINSEKVSGKIESLVNAKENVRTNSENVSQKIENLVKGEENVSRKIENLVKGKENVSRVSTNSENVTDGNSTGLSLLNAKWLCHSMNSVNGSESLHNNVALDVPRNPDEIKELSTLLDDDLHFIRGHTMMHGIVDGDGSKDSCVSSISVPKQCNKVGMDITRIDGDINDTLVIGAHGYNDEGECEAGHGQFFPSIDSSLHFMDSQESKVGGSENLTDASLNKSSFIGQSRTSGSQGCKLFNLEKDVEENVTLNGEGEFNTNDSLDMDKACSCSFCLKAAYLWSDLHYQDTHGRLAALEKSRKKVKLLVGRSYNNDSIGTIASENTKKSTKLEFDLMHQWRSLFLHTDDALAHEKSQLQSNLHSLKELRGIYKKDLEMIEGASSVFLRVKTKPLTSFVAKLLPKLMRCVPPNQALSPSFLTEG